MRTQLIFILSLGLILTGCQTQTTQPASTLEPADDAGAVTYEQDQFNEESLYELLVAELAGQQRDFALAQQLLERQAVLNQNAELAERATRLAQFLRDTERLETSASAWQSIQPENDAPLQILVNTLLAQKKFPEAMDILVEKSELSSETLMIIDSHRQNFSAEQSERMLDLLSRHHRKEPGQLDLMLVQAHLLRQLGRSEEALSLINEGLEIESTQADLVFEKAQIIADEGKDLSEALRLVDAAISENTTHRELRALQVRLLLQVDPKRVDDAVNQALSQADRDPKLVYYYALLLLENEVWDLSQQLFEELLAADPAVSELYLYLGIIEQSRGNSEAAISAFSEVEEGSNLLNAMSRALSLMDTERERERAKALIEAAIEKDPERTTDLVLIEAQWLVGAEKVDAALALLSEQLEKTPEETQLLYYRALVLDGIDTDLMIADLERAIDLSPQNPNIQNALGYTLLEYSDQYERAYQLISQALEQLPEDPAILDSMGWALHKLGRDAQALPYLEQAYDLFPDPEVGGHLIIVLANLGEQERARALLESLLEEHPDSEDLEEARRWLDSN